MKQTIPISKAAKISAPTELLNDAVLVFCSVINKHQLFTDQEIGNTKRSAMHAGAVSRENC